MVAVLRVRIPRVFQHLALALKCSFLRFFTTTVAFYKCVERAHVLLCESSSTISAAQHRCPTPLDPCLRLRRGCLSVYGGPWARQFLNHAHSHHAHSHPPVLLAVTAWKSHVFCLSAALIRMIKHKHEAPMPSARLPSTETHVNRDTAYFALISARAERERE